MGSLAAAGAATIGTGAFTSVQADRTVSVSVADDANAFLAIEPESNSPNANEYVDTSGNAVSLDFTSTDAPGNGQGINDNATTEFDDLLRITNQGTQGVYVGYGGDGSGTTLTNANFALYHEDPDFTGSGSGSNYDASAGNYNNDGQLNIDTAPDADSDGNPDLVYLTPGETLNNVGAFFFGSPDTSTINSTPVTFRAAATFADL